MNERTLAPTIVGRQRPLADLAASAALAGAGAGQLVLVSGEAGVGKTRLLREFAGQVGAPAYVGRCYDEQPAPPYGPFVELLRAIGQSAAGLRLGELAGPWADALRRLLPELAPADAPARPGDPPAERHRLFQAVFQALRPRDGELRVLIVEDLHWADEASQDLLQFLARAIAGERIVLIGSYRSDEIHRLHPLAGLIARLARDRRPREIQLAPLSRDELAEMLAATLGRPPAHDLLSALYERSEGNPFFAEELLGPLIAGEAALPISIRESILRRAAGLDEPAQRVLRAAAVIGRRFDFELLRRLTGLDERQLIASLSTLVERQLIAEEAAGDDDSYHFRHELIREALYEEMLRRERRLRHHEVLRALEELAAAGREAAIDQLAYHAIQARATPQAARYSEQAGDRAAAIHAYRAALSHYEAALDAADDEGPAGRAALLARLGRAAFLIGDLGRASGYWREALGLYQQLGDTRRAADTQRSLARVAWDQGDRRAAFAHARAALAALEGGEPCRELAMAYSTLSNLAMLSSVDRPGHAAECIAWGERALALARQIDDRATICHALNNIGTVMCDSGREQEGMRNLRHSLAIALDADLPADAVRAYLNLGGRLCRAGYNDEGVALLREGWSYAARHGSIRGSGKLLGLLLYSLIDVGRWPEAEALLAEVTRPGTAELLDEIGLVRYAQAALHWMHNRIEPARALLEQMLADEIGDPGHAMHLLTFVYRAQGELRRAEALADRMVAQARVAADIGPDSYDFGRRAINLTAAVEIYIDVERRAEAEALIAALEAATGHTTAGHEAAIIAELRGLAELATDPRAAAAHMARAADFWAHTDRLPNQVRLGRRRAAALMACPGPAMRSQARQQIAAARELAERLGYAYELARLNELDAPAPGRDPDGLTPREREVLALITRGLSNRAIAEALVISEKTAEVHVRNILAKLGFSSRTQAAAYAVERGMSRA